jgi:hypothetical protein
MALVRTDILEEHSGTSQKMAFFIVTTMKNLKSYKKPGGYRTFILI